MINYIINLMMIMRAMRRYGRLWAFSNKKTPNPGEEEEI